MEGNMVFWTSQCQENIPHMIAHMPQMQTQPAHYVGSSHAYIKSRRHDIYICIGLVCTPLTHTDTFTLQWCIDMLTSMSYPHCPHSCISLLLSLSHTHACLTVHSNRTVVLHLSMLFMRKWRSGPWMMSSFLWVAWPTPPGKPIYAKKKKKSNIQITFKKNIRGTKLRANQSHS